MTDDTTIDDLRKRMDALSSGLVNANQEIEELQEENDALRERIAELEEVVAPNPGSTEYAELSRDRKVFVLRKALVEKAASNAGAAAMTYSEVRAVWDYRPSVGHAYDLMEAAAEADGFEYDTHADTNRLTVETDAVNDETLVHAVKNPTRDAPA